MPPGISLYHLLQQWHISSISVAKSYGLPPFYRLLSDIFPKLIMGPIERYDVWAGQLKNTWQPAMLEEGAIRFLMGLSQKLLLADALAPLWSYTSTHSVSMTSAWLGLLAYTFQIYFDFRKHLNMAIGLRRDAGIRLQENTIIPIHRPASRTSGALTPDSGKLVSRLILHSSGAIERACGGPCEI